MHKGVCKISIPGFQIFCNDRNHHGDGVLTGADLGGFVGFERTPLFADSFNLATGSLLLPAVFDTQRWRATPVWLLYI